MTEPEAQPPAPEQAATPASQAAPAPAPRAAQVPAPPAPEAEPPAAAPQATPATAQPEGPEPDEGPAAPTEDQDQTAGARARERRKQERSKAPPGPTEEGVLEAWQALQKIQAGEEIKGVRIENLRLRGTFDKPVVLRRVTLVNCQFEKATFKDRVQLFGCKLVNTTFRRHSRFEAGLALSGSTLARCAFHNVTFGGTLDMDNVHGTDPIRFQDCSFEGEGRAIRLWASHFEDWFEMKNCQLRGEADLRSFAADEGMIFQGCTFAKDVLFRGAAITKKLDLGDCRFEGLIDLSKAKLHDFVYLEGIEQGDAQSFAFFNAVAERLLVSPEQLEGRISSEKRGRHQKAAQEYGLLKRSYETLHRFDDEDWAFYRFKVNQRHASAADESRSPFWRRVRELADWIFLDVGCGYGTDPFRAVRAALVVIAFFTLVYLAGSGGFTQSTLERYPGFTGRLTYCLVTSVSVFTSGFGGDQLGEAHGWILFPLMLEALLGTLLWGLFIVAFSRKVIR